MTENRDIQRTNTDEQRMTEKNYNPHIDPSSSAPPSCRTPLRQTSYWLVLAVCVDIRRSNAVDVLDIVTERYVRFLKQFPCVEVLQVLVYPRPSVEVKYPAESVNLSCLSDVSWRGGLTPNCQLSLAREFSEC